MLGFERWLEACCVDKQGKVVQAEGTAWARRHRGRRQILGISVSTPSPTPKAQHRVWYTVGVNTCAEHGQTTVLPLGLVKPQ